MLPIDINLQKASPEEVAVKFNLMDEPDAAKRAMRLEEAKGNIPEKQKAAKDKKHAKPDCFQEGELVPRKTSYGRREREESLVGHTSFRRHCPMEHTSLPLKMASVCSSNRC